MAVYAACGGGGGLEKGGGGRQRAPPNGYTKQKTPPAIQGCIRMPRKMGPLKVSGSQQGTAEGHDVMH
jgi:hypothetical protein